jgi:hypothetical protein
MEMVASSKDIESRIPSLSRKANAISMIAILGMTYKNGKGERRGIIYLTEQTSWRTLVSKEISHGPDQPHFH